MNTRSVTASELAQYIYCECCWMDMLEGKVEQTFAMEEGAREHDKLFGNFVTLQMIRQIGMFLVYISLIALAAVGIVYFVTHAHL